MLRHFIRLQNRLRIFPHASRSFNSSSATPSTGAVSKNRMLDKDFYDVFIVGGGVSGSALLYELCTFTDLKRIALAERRAGFAQVASAANNNSQTIHCGDIETNYSPEKAKTVKRQADMLRNFATKLPVGVRDRIVVKLPKMALGVGSAECKAIEDRFHSIKDVFTNAQLINKKQIAEIEPRVALINSHSQRPEELAALYVADEYSAINYFELCRTFIQISKETGKADITTNNEVSSIERTEEGFRLTTSQGVVQARNVVVSACGYSLLMAQKMGYGLHFSCLPMAGSFYFTDPVLNGKVYTVQNPKLPFAAVHGDPDVMVNGMTRFGPTALPLPLLERYNWKSFPDFLKVLNFDLSLASVYWDLLKVSTLRNYVMRNFLFEVPGLSTRLFLKDVRKIVPSLQQSDLTYASGFGGVRPQLIDKKAKKLLLGEGKINPGTGIIFNITPSPGGTTCLGNAEKDMRQICNNLGATIDEESFKKHLLNGEYATL